VFYGDSIGQKMLKFAIMSDLHIGIAARSKDLCPEPKAAERKKKNRYNIKVDNKYREYFLDFIEKEKITADYLVLPGDITNSAHPEEVRLASEFIVEVADVLEVPHDKIVFTPGNHDVDWSVYDATDSTGVKWKQRYNAFYHDDFHFNSLLQRGVGDVFLPPHFVLWSFDDIIVLSYNSASHDEPKIKGPVHHGLADPAHLEKISIQLDKINGNDKRLRVFLVHHHPIDFSDPIASTADFSLMTNASNLLELLHKYNFDIVVHGHKHHPRFETHCTPTYPHLPILCAGSFSVEIDSKWAGTIANQFHLVVVEDKKFESVNIQGEIISWAYNPVKRWFPSEESSCGIHHVVPFGNYIVPDELDALVYPFICEALRKNDNVLWKNVLKEFPNLKHLPVKSAEEAFKRYSEKLDCEVYFYTSIHGIMLSTKE